MGKNEKLPTPTACHFRHMMPKISIYTSGVSSFCTSYLVFKCNVTCSLLSLQENPSMKTVARIVQISAKRTSDKISYAVEKSLLRFKKEPLYRIE